MERILKQPTALQIANLNLQYLLLKRALDVILSAAALVVLAPLFLLVAMAVKADGGSAFYRQKRVGKGGRFFTLLKFRSMIPDADKRVAALQADNEMSQGVIFKIKKDPRITKVGRVLRKYSIDELPQLWNVFVGDMTLVGPRPALPAEVSKYEKRHLKRLQVDQGLTCFWQVQGRNHLDFEQQVALDLSYINKASLLLDLRLIFQTIPAVLSGKGAY